MDNALLEKIDKSQLDSLSEAEKALFLDIIKEYGETGESKTHQALLYEDYNEIPVDIDTFIDDERYLRYAWYDTEGKCKLYPFWRDQLHLIFPNNLEINYNNLIESGARGLGKSEIAVLIAAYLMYRLMCLKNPLEHFHMKPTEKFCFAFMNIKIDDAEEIANHKFQNTVKLSPWFLSHGTLQGRGNKMWVPPEYIDIIIGSGPSDVIGKPIYFAFFDEISFIKNQDIEIQKKKAMDMIDTAVGGMLTRFIYKGKNPTLLVLASSKRSDKSFLEEHMKKLIEEKDVNSLIIDKAVWEVKPAGTYGEGWFRIALGNKFKVSQIIPDKDEDDIWIRKGYQILKVPEFFRAKFRQDLERSLCDYAGRSSSELSKYISGTSVEDNLDDSLQNPFIDDVIEVGNDKKDLAEYKNFFDLDKVDKSMMSKPLFVHLDMSVSGDMTGIAGVWIKGKKVSTDENMSKDLTFQLAFSVSVKAPKGRQISFEKNRNFVRWLKQKGFKIKKLTSDTFQAYDLQQQLKSEGFDCEILSVDRVDSDHICKPYQYLKSTIDEGRIRLYPSKKLITELTELERNINTGKVDHPPNGSKDAADAVCGATFTASKYAEEFAFDYGEDLDTVIEANKSENEIAQEQLTVDFQKELEKMGPIFGQPLTDLYGRKVNKDEYEDDDDDDDDEGYYGSIENGSLIW